MNYQIMSNRKINKDVNLRINMRMLTILRILGIMIESMQENNQNLTIIVKEYYNYKEYNNYINKTNQIKNRI